MTTIITRTKSLNSRKEYFGFILSKELTKLNKITNIEDRKYFMHEIFKIISRNKNIINSEIELILLVKLKLKEFYENDWLPANIFHYEIFGETLVK